MSLVRAQVLPGKGGVAYLKQATNDYILSKNAGRSINIRVEMREDLWHPACLSLRHVQQHM
jgi:hypothetical protein